MRKKNSDLNEEKVLQIETWQQTLCGWGLQTAPALAVSLLQGDVQARRGEGVAALVRLDQVPEKQDVMTHGGQIRRQNMKKIDQFIQFY